MTTRSVLNREQLGHLRHWDNLSRQLPNDWSLMQGKSTSQDDFGGYRFQLAYMIYGLALRRPDASCAPVAMATFPENRMLLLPKSVSLCQ